MLPTSASGGFHVRVTDYFLLLFEWVVVSLLELHLMGIVLVLESGLFHDPVVPFDVLACTNNPLNEAPDADTFTK